MPTPLIATDLDGTLLLSGGHTPHPESAAAVRRAIAAGIPVAFATGRAPSEVLAIADLVGHRWFAVCCDGTAIVDLRSEEVVRTHPIGAAEKRIVVQRLRARFPNVKFLVDRVNLGPIVPNLRGLIVETGFEAPWAWALEGSREVSNIDEVIEDPNIVKMCAFLPLDGSKPDFFHMIHSEVSDLVEAVRINSGLTFVDMNAKGISKATGVAALAELEGIPQEDVFAVGDMHNDVQMLLWAGNAFAVRNAVQQVHDVADLIVPSNDDGGVVHVIEAAFAHLQAS